MHRMSLMILVSLLSACAAVMPIQHEDSTYQKVIELPNKSKDTIFEKSKQWIALNFKSTKAVIEYDNKPEGIIIGNGTMLRPKSIVHITGTDVINFTMIEEIKDNKARFTFHKFGIVSQNNLVQVMGADLNGMQDQFDDLVVDLQVYVLRRNQDNW